MVLEASLDYIVRSCQKIKNTTRLVDAALEPDTAIPASSGNICMTPHTLLMAQHAVRHPKAAGGILGTLLGGYS